MPIFFGVSYQSETGSTIYHAYSYAAAVIVTRFDKAVCNSKKIKLKFFSPTSYSALNVIIMHPFVLGVQHLGMKIRIAVCSMIYRKSLKLSKNALGDTTAGQVVNLISNDVARLDMSMMFVHFLWVGPLETVAVTYLMYREVSEFKMNVKHLKEIYSC